MTRTKQLLRHVVIATFALSIGSVWYGPANAVDRNGDRSPASQNAVFSTRVDRVRVDVSVRQDGRAVRDLRAADFEVLDNGVPQRVDLVGFEETPVNAVLAFDMSGSVQGARLDQLRRAGTRFVEAIGPDDMAALVAFTDLVTIRSRFTADKRHLLEALNQPALGADTSLIDAMHTAMVLGESESGRPVVIVFSDGADTSSFLSVDQVLNTARRTGPVVYAVTSSQAERRGFLDDLVRLTGGRRLEIASLDRLSDAFAEILSEARQRYLLSYTPTGVDAGGWHELTVRVRNRRADIRARPGYLVGQ